MVISRKNTCLSYVSLIYSALTIAYYAAFFVFLKSTDYYVSTSNFEILSVVLFTVSMIFKTVSLLIVKKRIGIIVGISIIISIIYNSITGIMLSFVILGIGLFAAIVLMFTKRRNKNALINVILPLAIVSLSFGFLTMLNGAPVSHVTTDLHTSPSGEYVISEKTYWNFNKPIRKYVELRKNESVIIFGSLELQSDDSLTVSLKSNNSGDKITVEWLDNNTFTVDGDRRSVLSYFD